MNAWERTCHMCDKPAFWSTVHDEWEHTENRSIYCPEKSASVIEVGSFRTEGTQRYIDSGEYEGEYDGSE